MRPPQLAVSLAKEIPGAWIGMKMPRYEFLCEKCQKPFEQTMTISEHAKGKVRCPTCKSTRVVPQLSGFMGQTKKKS
jgi:putative FmdB family regulatory protein